MRNNYALYAQEAKRALYMRQVFERYGVSVNRAGYALCPFHEENTPSLKVYEDSFYCFGCNEGGDAIRFVQDLFSLNFCEAVEKLNADFMLGLPIGQRLTVRKAHAMKQRNNIQAHAKAGEAAQEEQKFTVYLNLLQEYEMLQSIMEMCAPFSGEEPPEQAWLYASHRLEYVGYLLDSFYLPDNAVRCKRTA